MLGQQLDVVALPSPCISLLGPFTIYGGNGLSLEIPTKKNRALIAILALSPNRQATRERLCGLLWGDRNEEHARSSLRQSLAVLRKELGRSAQDILQFHNDLIKLHSVDVDVDMVLRASLSTDMSELRSAAQLFRGDLLSDTSVTEESFGQWLAIERRKISDAAVCILENLAMKTKGEEGVQYAKRLVDIDPLRESSHRTLMLAYHHEGETGLAIHQYEVCCKILRDEFNVVPSERTRDLRHQIASAQSSNTLAPQVSATPHMVAPGALTDEEFQLIDNLTFGDLAANARAQALCRRAINAHPGDARPIAILASLMHRLWLDNIDVNDSVLAEASTLARGAVELDKDNPYCHLVLTDILLLQRQHELALKHFDRAWQLTSDTSKLTAKKAHLELYLGNPTKALMIYQQAKAVDPCFNEHCYWSMTGLMQYALQNYENSLQSFAKVTDARVWIEAYMAAGYAHLEQFERARHHALKVWQMCPEFSIAANLKRDPYRREEDEENAMRGMILAGLDHPV